MGLKMREFIQCLCKKELDLRSSSSLHTARGCHSATPGRWQKICSLKMANQSCPDPGDVRHHRGQEHKAFLKWVRLSEVTYDGPLSPLHPRDGTLAHCFFCAGWQHCRTLGNHHSINCKVKGAPCITWRNWLAQDKKPVLPLSSHGEATSC